MKVLICLSVLLIFSFFYMTAQNSVSTDRATSSSVQIGLGVESWNNINGNETIFGFKLNTAVPIFSNSGLVARVSFSDSKDYYGYCGDNFYKENEMHFTTGLSYPVYHIGQVSASALAGADFAGYFTNEAINTFGVSENLLHDHDLIEDHPSFDLQTSFEAGMILSYDISKRFGLMLDSRMNTVGDIKNSLNVNYSL